jgi:periplasmic protein TonB
MRAAGFVARSRDTSAFSVGITVSTVLHFAVLAWAPSFGVADIGAISEEMRAVDVPPEIVVPPAPERIARPATPIVARTTIDEDITIAPTTFEANPVESIVAPPTTSIGAQDDIRAAPTFTPYTVRPELRNAEEIKQALQRTYPPLLREAGIGGRVLLWVFISERGEVENAVIKEGASHQAFDDAALAVVPLMVFSPAINRDRRVPVWIELPLVFTTR